MESIDFWKLCDELTAVQAALLVVGHNPSKHPEVERKVSSRRPEGYDAARHAIMAAIKTKRILGSIGTYREEADGEEYVSANATTVDVNSLKDWLVTKGLTRHFFFFPETKVSEFLDRDHPRYSPKLAAAVTAWQTLDEETKLEGKTPKQAVQKWLREHAAEYGICDEDGKPNESVVDSISQIVNWRTKGGAPRTPNKQDLEERSISTPAQMSVTRPDAPKTNVTSIDLDDDIPF